MSNAPVNSTFILSKETTRGNAPTKKYPHTQSRKRACKQFPRAVPSRILEVRWLPDFAWFVLLQQWHKQSKLSNSGPSYFQNAGWETPAISLKIRTHQIISPLNGFEYAMHLPIPPARTIFNELYSPKNLAPQIRKNTKIRERTHNTIQHDHCPWPYWNATHGRGRRSLCGCIKPYQFLLFSWGH